MKPYPLLFRPSFKERIWGGTKLKKIFNCTGLEGNIGEAWVISDHPNGKSVIVNREFTGKTLVDLLQICPEWFCRSHMRNFPLLVKLLNSNEELSVQVHPDDEYAIRNEDGASGKTECWYIIESEPGAEIVFDHKARDKKEFIKLSTENKWNELLVRVPVKPGDFFFIPSGTVHALGKGIVLLEIQQNSDLTYRIYDYNRIGLDGNKRDLHFEKALNVIKYGSVSYNGKLNLAYEIGFKTILASCKHFTVEKWVIKESCKLISLDVFILICIIKGNGALLYEDGVIMLTMGYSIMIPANMGKYQIKGNIEAIACYVHNINYIKVPYQT